MHVVSQGGGTDRIRVVIADPDPLARRVIRDDLQSRPEFIVVAEARDGVEALELCRHYGPDALVSEIDLPRRNGIDVAQTLRSEDRGINVVILSVQGGDELELRALRAGAVGFLPKDCGANAVASSLQAVMRGEAAISRRLTMRLIERLRTIPEAGSGMRPIRSNLTPREWEVLDLLVTGANTRDIADQLFLTQDTVYSHVKNIMRKLGVRSRSEAVAKAEQLLDMQVAA
jgi:DNA-binding NarL/FixJ family response regulator